MPELKAVRSRDLETERWDLIAWPSVAAMLERIPNIAPVNPQSLDSLCLKRVTDYLSGEGPDALYEAWAALAVYIQYCCMGSREFKEWVATREFTNPWSMAPFHALRRLAQVLHEGASKYGDWNWLLGFPVNDILAHAVRHLTLHVNDLSKEDDLGHAQANLMMAVTMRLFRPDMCTQVLGPNCSLTPAILEALADRIK